MASTPITIDCDAAARRSSLTVPLPAGSVVGLRPSDWSSGAWGIGVSTVVHVFALGLAALIVISPKFAPIEACLNSQWSAVEGADANFQTTVLLPTQSYEPVQTRDPGGSSLAEIVDLAPPVEFDELTLVRDAAPGITVTNAKPPRAPKHSRERSLGASKRGEPQATVGQGGGDGNGSGDGRGFFGTVPGGKSVVFVVDNSGSMNHPDNNPAVTRYQRMKFELVKSILELPAESQFYVIFFCDVTHVMPASDLQPATPQLKEKYVNWIAGVETGGGPTEPRGAMQKALRLKPDVIFFLTDGEFDEPINLKLMSIRQPRTTIHTFAFGERLGEEVLRALAQKNHGRYRFIQ
jgi:von Willebrand factor type A domain